MPISFNNSRLLRWSGAGHDRDVHALLPLDLVQFDFRENRLVRDAERIIATAVKRTGRNAAEITNTRQRGRDQAIEKLIHRVAAQRHVAADRLAFAQFEIRDALARDLLMTGLRPVIMLKSFAASSIAPFSSEALTPMLTTIFSIFGTWWTLLYFRFSFRAGRTSFSISRKVWLSLSLFTDVAGAV